MAWEGPAPIRYLPNAHCPVCGGGLLMESRRDESGNFSWMRIVTFQCVCSDGHKIEVLRTENMGGTFRVLSNG